MDICKMRGILDKYDKRPILVYFDPDVDGLMSGLLVCKYLDSLGLKYGYYVNTARAHGFKLDHSTLSGYLVIAVDFAVTSEEMTSLVWNDVAVIVLDHHDTEDELIHKKSPTSEGVVLNNQYPFEPEEDRYLSGAGVVFEAICKLDPEFDTKEHRAIVGITLLSDARPIENNKAKGYLKSAYTSNPKEGYIGYLLSSTIDSDYGFGLPKLDRNFIDYTFSPRINAMLRFGKEKEAMSFILGGGMSLPSLRGAQKILIEEMKENMRLLELSSTKIVVIVVEELLDSINSKLEGFKQSLSLSIKGEGFQLDTLVSEIMDSISADLNNFIGLLCSNIKGTGKSTVAFILQGGRVTRASFRGQYDDVDYREGFRSLGINAQGHHGAFGIIDFTYTDDTWVAINSVVEKLNGDHATTASIIEVSNLPFLLTRRGYDLASNNCYVRDLYRTYIRYTGSKIAVARQSDKYTEYLVDGQKVKCFDKLLTPNTGLILPVLEKGYVQLYLKEDIQS